MHSQHFRNFFLISLFFRRSTCIRSIKHTIERVIILLRRLLNIHLHNAKLKKKFGLNFDPINRAHFYELMGDFQLTSVSTL